MICLLISILVVALIVGVIYYCITILPVPTPVRQIALVFCVLIFLIWILNIIGVVGTPWRVHL